MNLTDLRNNCRESSIGQRILDLRKNPHTYGTPEWRDYILRNGLEFPTHDRRKADRDNGDKGSEHRRVETKEKPYVRVLLTQAEKKLLEDIYLGELD
jgi:hypothetical protein